MNDLLLPGWNGRIEAAAARATPSPMPRPPLSRLWLVGETHFVQDRESAGLLVQAACESPISWVGTDTEFRYESEIPRYVHNPGKESEKEVWDIRTIRPFCLAFALVSGDSVFRFVVDLRVGETLDAVQQVLGLRVPFIAHFAEAELYVIWTLGLREPEIVWDTLVAEQASELGRFPTRSDPREDESDADEIQRRDQVKAQRERRYSLEQVLLRHGLKHAAAGSKPGLQRSFLTKPFHQPLSPAEVSYCADDAQAVAELYPYQRMACDRAGITHVLDRVIQPWRVNAAEIKWHGVRYDLGRCKSFLVRSTEICAEIRSHLDRSYGLDNPGSTKQISNLLEPHVRGMGLDRSLPRTKTGNLRLQDKDLEQLEHVHEAIRWVRCWRKVRLLASDPAVNGLLTASDGRVHPSYRVLGAATGRTQSRLPNVMGIGRAFRPLVCAAEGYGIGEVDLSQIEVGIAAAVFRDRNLTDDFNTSDVYLSMVKRLFADRIPPEDLDLPWREFQKRYEALRNQAKPLVLGIIYGKGVPSLALELGVSRPEAKELMAAFRSLYPDLCEGMERARSDSARRGYASFLGLRRFLERPGSATAHDLRGLGNACVQGAAAVIFFDAGNRLRRLYRQYAARIIIPVHDAFVFECRVAHIEEVAELTRSVMIQTVQEWLPGLRPRAKRNIEHPECWNHDGHRDSVERFLDDLMRMIRPPGCR